MKKIMRKCLVIGIVFLYLPVLSIHAEQAAFAPTIPSNDETAKMMDQITQDHTELYEIWGELTGEEVNSINPLSVDNNALMYKVYPMTDNIAYLDTDVKVRDHLPADYVIEVPLAEDVIATYKENNKGSFELLGVSNCKEADRYFKIAEVKQTLEQLFDREKMAYVYYISSKIHYIDFALVIDSADEEWIVPFTADDMYELKNGTAYRAVDFIQTLKATYPEGVMTHEAILPDEHQDAGAVTGAEATDNRQVIFLVFGAVMVIGGTALLLAKRKRTQS